MAVLARETSLVVVAGLAAAELWRLLAGGPAGGDVRAVAWLAVPVVVAVGWQLVLGQVWGVLPVRAGGPTNFGGLPVLGVLGSLAADVPGPAVVTVVVTVERVGGARAVRVRGLGAGDPPGPADRRRDGRLGARRRDGAGAVAAGRATCSSSAPRTRGSVCPYSSRCPTGGRSGRWVLLLAAAMTCGVARGVRDPAVTAI